MPTDRPPKILILGEAAAIHTRRWVSWVEKRGWTARWLSFPPIPDGCHAEAIPPRARWRALGIALNVRHLRQIIDDFRPDVISALFIPDYGWLATLADRHPLAVSAWGSDILIAPRKSALHRRRIISVLRSADLLFADAECLGAEMKCLGAPPERIRIIPLGVEPEWLEAGERRTPHTGAAFAVISTRRLEPLYRVSVFLNALAKLDPGSGNRFRATIVGDGSERAALESQARSLGLGAPPGRIEFTGSVTADEMKTRLTDADIYVSCSESDGTSVSLLEAMAVGCFPIVTDLPANREWITPGGNGLLFPVGDADALVSAIHQASADSGLRQRAHKSNLEIISQRALWPDNMTQVEDDLRRLITRKTG